MNTWNTILLALMLGGGASMVMPDAAAASGNALQGVWGGERMQLSIDPQGARLSADCASGSIGTPLVVNARGGFVARGHFSQHQPGPQQADEEAPPNARFSADVQGDLMTLTITTDATTTPQVVKLRKGAHVKLLRCM